MVNLTWLTSTWEEILLFSKRLWNASYNCEKTDRNVGSMEMTIVWEISLLCLAPLMYCGHLCHIFSWERQGHINTTMPIQGNYRVSPIIMTINLTGGAYELKIWSSYEKLKSCLVLFKVKQMTNVASQLQKRAGKGSNVLFTPNLEHKECQAGSLGVHDCRELFLAWGGRTSCLALQWYFYLLIAKV